MPFTSEIHRDRAMENVSLKYTNDRLVADALCPSIPVKRESDLYYIYSKDSFRLPISRRADTSESNRAFWHASTSSYQLHEESLHDYVSDRQRDNADVPIQMDIDTTENLTGQIAVRKEYDLTQLMTTTMWSNSTSNTSTLRWSFNTATSNPISMIDTATSIIAQTSGKLPNVFVVSDPGYRSAKEHVAILDHIKYTSADSVTPQMLARLFNVEQVLVAGGIYNNGDDGLADSMQYIWPDIGFLAYVERSPGIKKVSALYQFRKEETGNPWKVERWREPRRTSDAIQVSSMYTFQAVATDCAYLINDLV